LFDQIVASDAQRPPRQSTPLNVVSVLVHLLTLVTFAAGVAMLADGFGLILPVRIFLGALAVLIAFLVQPFWHRRKKPKSKPLTKDTAPALFELVDQVASNMGCKGLDGIRVNADFNASIGHTRSEGWVMTIGLALWSTLSRQQRVALIGHELGHQLNHDQRRSMLVHGAAVSLAQWSYLLNPRGRITPISGLAAMAEWLVMLLLLPICAAAATLAWIVHLLGCRQGLAAEYYADILGSKVAGTDATVGMLERLLLGEQCYRHLMHTAQFNKSANPWSEVANYAAAIPANELERQRRLGRLRLPAIDSSHPASQLRADLIRELPYQTAKVALDAGHEAAIDRELAGATDAATAWLRSHFPR
jgi:hypothetical protein